MHAAKTNASNHDSQPRSNIELSARWKEVLKNMPSAKTQYTYNKMQYCVFLYAVFESRTDTETEFFGHVR